MSNKRQIPKEIQEALQKVQAELAEKGFRVDTAAFAMDSNGELSPMGRTDSVQEMLSEAGIKSVAEQKEEGPCFCTNCFNYETFESVLGTEGIFDNQVVTMTNGTSFNLKYYEGPLGEHIVMQKDEAKFSRAEIQKQFEEAVKEKNYEKAQKLLLLLSKFEN